MFIIDRFEEDWVVIEFDGKTFNLPILLLPTEAREGDVLTIQINVDKEATQVRQEKVKDLTEGLFED